jgi:hypothetical protein
MVLAVPEEDMNTKATANWQQATGGKETGN